MAGVMNFEIISYRRRIIPLAYPDQLVCSYHPRSAEERCQGWAKYRMVIKWPNCSQRTTRYYCQPHAEMAADRHGIPMSEVAL
jgi:hypothetical protein